MHALKRLVCVAFVLLVMLVAAPAGAVPPPPDKKVQDTIQKVKEIVQSQPNKGSAVLDKKLRDVLFPLFDFKQMSRSSLGANWRTATPEEQAEFERLFSDLLARTYLKRIKSGVVESEIEVKNAAVDGDKATVKTLVKGDGDPIAIDYRLQADGDNWRVYDVAVENVGLITNYREEFAEVVRENGMKALIEKLKAKEREKDSSDRG